MDIIDIVLGGKRGGGSAEGSTSPKVIRFVDYEGHNEGSNLNQEFVVLALSGGGTTVVDNTVLLADCDTTEPLRLEMEFGNAVLWVDCPSRMIAVESGIVTQMAFHFIALMNSTKYLIDVYIFKNELRLDCETVPVQ